MRTSTVGALVIVVLALLVAVTCACVSVPKDQAIKKDVQDSPGSTVDAIDGDEALIAAVANKRETTIADTDQSQTEQAGKVNAKVESKVNAGGNVNSDDWTSRILAIAALVGVSVYATRYRLPTIRRVLDYVGGR